MPPTVVPFLRLKVLDSSRSCRQCAAQFFSTSLRRPLQPSDRCYGSSISASRLSAAYFSPNSSWERPRLEGKGSHATTRLFPSKMAPTGSTATFTSTSSSAASLPFFSSSTSTTPTSTSSAVAEPLTARTSQTEPPTESANGELPHRRRQAARRHAKAAASSTSVLPSQDASSALTTKAASLPTNSLRRAVSAFLSLSKPRLTVLVVLSAMVPYALYPVPAFLAPAALADASPSLSPLTLLFLTSGTALCSAAANALNMLYELATDAKMSRTRNRPLVRNLLSRRAALLFALLSAATGSAALYFGVNPTVSFLGAANIVLYAGIYTPLKAFTVANTWVGALVGGIPPLMGWAAAAGESATGDGSWRELLFAGDGSSLGGWLLGSFLVAWQFPHFMALSWSIREEYKAAGLRMLAWTNPARNARVALRYSLIFVPLCAGLCAAGVTEWSYAVTSLPVNGWLIWQAVRFWRFEGNKGSARGLFWASVWHLPGVFVLALVQKKGMWTRVWRSIVGEEEEEDDDDEWEEDDL